MKENKIYYTMLECKKCNWKSSLLNPKELQELGVPWYCENCGNRVTHFHKGTLEEFEKSN